MRYCLGRLKGKNLVITSLAVACLLATLFWVGVHEPLMAEIEATDAQQKNIAQAEIDLENFLNRHPDRDAYTAELKARESYLAGLLPEEMNESDFIAFLERKALRHGVLILGVTPGEGYVVAGCRAHPIDLTLETDYFSLLAFLREVEGDRFLRWEGGTIESDEGKLTCRLKLTIFALAKP
ncbi:MAG: hypothetical protein IJ849_11270 [Selenomonadaceae bacterium]|nr:hypothetical protein [Selenomonadaceae bacterium]